jgi:hypothetical protein
MLRSWAQAQAGNLILAWMDSEAAERVLEFCLHLQRSLALACIFSSNYSWRYGGRTIRGMASLARKEIAIGRSTHIFIPTTSRKPGVPVATGCEGGCWGVTRAGSGILWWRICRIWQCPGTWLLCIGSGIVSRLRRIGALLSRIARGLLRRV